MKNNITDFVKARKSLIFILLLQCFTANAGKWQNLSTRNFTKSCLESGKDLIADKKICIPSGESQHPPKLFGAKGLYLQNIEMSNVQIITIEKQTITISMYLKVDWKDNRVKINPSSQSIYLSQLDQKRLWSPQIVIGTNMVSQNKEEEFVLTQCDPPKHWCRYFRNGFRVCYFHWLCILRRDPDTVFFSCFLFMAVLLNI